MASGPVQLVMNPNWFRQEREPRVGGGSGKDFYRGDARGFAEHRATIAASMRAILRRNLTQERINVTIRMRPDALAKSHRPFGSLFTPRRASHVGTGNYGELVFALTPTNLEKVIDLVESAEVEERWKPNAMGTPIYSPSLARTEVSAMQDVREWQPANERGYTLEEAESWLAMDATAKARVELFDLPDSETLRLASLSEIRSLAPLTHGPSAWFNIVQPVDAIAHTIQQALEATTPATDIVRLPLKSRIFREALAQFEASAVVKQVRLEDRLPETDDELPTPAVAPSDSTSIESTATSRPVVGVIDGGILGAPFENSSWVAGRANFLANNDRDLRLVNHGTEIASLVAIGSKLNPQLLPPEEDCRVYDLNLFPTPSSYENYYGSLEDYLDEVRASVARAKDESGTRIFNLSYNLRRAPGATSYSLAAQGLDRIALDLDVIFVISAGNLTADEERDEWPPSSSEVGNMLARHSVPDGLFAPAESLANVSVGATNPPGLPRGIEGAPTPYTRRSVRIPSATKPDFAAPGGGRFEGSKTRTGLTAIDAFGTMRDVKGTSFAAPIVARYLASLDAAIAGYTSREMIIALASHSASLPQVLLAKELVDIAPSFVGRGILPTVKETLDGASYRMTIVISDTILPGKNVQFPFRWPDSLVSNDGKCRGLLKLTLVTQPIINYAHGAEMVRINLDGAVKQSDEDGKFEKRTQASHEFFSGYRYANERTLSTILGKWCLVKHYAARMPKGRGKSPDWHLDIDYLTRAAEPFPRDGVRFTAILTIEDMEKQAPVYDEMRASLSHLGVTLSDLRTAVNVGIQA